MPNQERTLVGRLCLYYFVFDVEQVGYCSHVAYHICDRISAYQDGQVDAMFEGTVGS